MLVFNFISNFILVSSAQFFTDFDNDGTLDTHGSNTDGSSRGKEFRLRNFVPKSSTDSYDWASNLLSSNLDDTEDCPDKVILIGS